MTLLYGPWLLLALLSLSATVSPAESKENSCDRLKATLTYTQEEAPRDLSSVVSDENEFAFSKYLLSDHRCQCPYPCLYSSASALYL